MCICLVQPVTTQVAAINRVGTESFPNEFTSGDEKPAHKVNWGGDGCLSPAQIMQ